MLNALFDKLSSSTFFSRSVLLGSFFPLVIGVVVNAVLFYSVSAWFRDLINRQTPPSTIVGFTFAAASVFFLFIVATYFVSAASTFFRETLIGRRWPNWISEPMRAAQFERARRLQAAIQEVERWRNEFDPDAWRRELQLSRDYGRLLPYCNFAGLQGDAAAAWAKIREDRRHGRMVRLDALRRVKDALRTELGAANVEFPNAAAAALQALHDEFDDLLGYAVERAAAEARKLANRQAVRFASHDLAPTAAGNVALTIVAYGADRYEFDVELLWSRLQKVVQSTDKDFYAVLQDAKTQLDFAVATFWILTLTSLFWIAALPFLTRSVTLFLAAAVLLPLAAAAANWLCVISYYAFADQVRAAIDLFRFDLAKALRLAYPATRDAERKTWDAVASITAYAGNDSLQYDQHGAQ